MSEAAHVWKATDSVLGPSEFQYCVLFDDDLKAHLLVKTGAHETDRFAYDDDHTGYVDDCMEVAMTMVSIIVWRIMWL